jgi:hypothetical protein
MTGDDTHNAFVAGYELGLALRCDQDIAEADHEALHALVRPMLDALVADMNARGVGDYAQLQERRRRHQRDAWQRNQAAARPWPPETAPLNPHALFGQPQRQRVNT